MTNPEIPKTESRFELVPPEAVSEQEQTLVNNDTVVDLAKVPTKDDHLVDAVVQRLQRVHAAKIVKEKKQVPLRLGDIVRTIVTEDRQVQDATGSTDSAERKEQVGKALNYVLAMAAVLPVVDALSEDQRRAHATLFLFEAWKSGGDDFSVGSTSA